MNNGLSVVISSVVDREDGFRDYRFVAKKAAEELGFDVVRNPEDAGIVQSTFEEVMSEKSPVVILIVGEEQSGMVLKEGQIALDHCLPLLVFIKKIKNKISMNSKEMISSISKMTYENDCACFTTCEELYSAVKSRLEKYLKKKVTAFPSMEAYIGPAYRYSIGMFDHAKKRVVLYQKTSSLILGPKKGNQTEMSFNKNLFAWLENMSPDMRFLHLYSGSQTAAAMSDEKYDIMTAKNNLKSLLERDNIKDNPSFAIRELSSEVTTSFFVCDCEAMYIFSLEDKQYTITIPPYIMRNREIDKIITELSRSGKNVDAVQLLEKYNTK